MKKFLKLFFPTNSLGFKILKRLAIFLHITPGIPIHTLNHTSWAERIESQLWTPQKKLEYQPLISIVVPVFNTPVRHFLPMVYSVVNQSYQKWELVLVDASNTKAAKQMTADAKKIDDRIKVVELKGNLGIGENTNKGLEKAKGEYVGLLDHDDLLAPQALYEVVCVLQSAKNRPEMIYSDEDHVTDKGEYRFDPFFKPNWSPILLQELNYINHFTVLKRTIYEKIGYFRPGFNGAQDYDLYLRASQAANRVVHIPKILYHWRAAKSSTASDFSSKPNILTAGKKALGDYLERSGKVGDVSALKNKPGFYRIDYSFATKNRLPIIVMPSLNQGVYRNFLFDLLKTIKKTGVLVDLYVQQPLVPIKEVPDNITLKTINAISGRMLISEATKTINNDFCLVINCAFSAPKTNWLKNMAGLMEQSPEIAIITPLITGSDNKTIIDSGLVKYNDQYLPLFQGRKIGKTTPLGDTDWARNLDAVSGRFFMIHTNLLTQFPELGNVGAQALSEQLYESVKKQNQQIVSWPFSRIIYQGSMEYAPENDSFLNPNFEISKVDFSPVELAHSVKESEDD